MYAFNACIFQCMCTFVYIIHAGMHTNIGPAESVRLLRFWLDQFFQGKNKIPFLQKAGNKQSASVILGLIRLIILSYNR